MPIKFKYAKKQDVPEEHSALYVEKDGVFVLDVEGAVEKSKLDEFRTKNVSLMEALKQFDGLDASEARDLLKRKAELDDANLVKSGDVQKQIDAKLNPVLAQLNAERERVAQLQVKLHDQTLTRAVTEAGTRRGVRASALPDLQSRAKSRFKLVDGDIVPSAEGETVTFDGWLDGLVTDAPHLFENNAGGGAAGNGSGGVGILNGQKNPFKKETWNLTEQSRITRQNPALAAQLARAAGR
jgi:hypothetical protein